MSRADTTLPTNETGTTLPETAFVDGPATPPPARHGYFPQAELRQPSVLLLFPAVFGALVLAVVCLYVVPLCTQLLPFLPEIEAYVLVPAAAVTAYVGFVYGVERRRAYELAGGLWGLGQFALGCALGPLQPGLVIAVWYALGVNRLTTLQQTEVFLHTLDAFLFLAAFAVFEELLFRGLLLRYLELKLGSYAAIALSAVAFSAWHLIDGRAGIGLAALALSGVALGSAYVLTRRLWLPLGLHVGYNLSLGLLFPSTTTIPLFRWEPHGSPFWVSQVGADVLWLLAEAVLAAALLAAVIVLRRGVGPSGAWLRQIGLAEEPGREAALSSSL